jgi:predicted homoserine dehydrogenase-like protein
MRPGDFSARPVSADTLVTFEDVELTRDLDVLELRRAIEDRAKGQLPTWAA